MAEAIVSRTVEMLGRLLIQEVSFLSGVTDKVQDLRAELQGMQCFLKDADKRRYESDSVRNWLREIRKLAYKAEDVLETYAIKVESRRGKGIKKALKRFACLVDEGSNLHNLGLEIENIKTGNANLTTRLQTYGIKLENDGQSSNATSRNLLRQTFAHEIEEHFVGMKHDVERLVSLLTERDEAHRVISIYGMGGLGKTTLAKKVLNHKEVTKHFDSFAWATVSQQLNADNLLQEILRQLDPRRDKDYIKKMEYKELVPVLCEVQTEKKCLIVLDDIWETEHWTILSRAFPTATAHCKVLLTTRKLGVAEAGIPHELSLFSEQEGWDLLKKKVLAGANAIDSPIQAKQENLGKQMVRKCGCLPLAISVIGGILSKKKTFEEWEMVNQDIDSYLRCGEGIEDNHQVIQILSLSYEDLPYQLKPCFLYLACYPEDAVIHSDSLCWMWIVEGMVLSKDQRSNETLMEVANRYLFELASRSLVQLQLVESSLTTNAYECRLHDLMRDVCLRKCEEEDFLKVMDFWDRKLLISNINAYRLSICCEEKDAEVVGKYVQEANQSTRFFNLNCLTHGKLNAYKALKNLKKLRFLRVVAFYGVDFSNTKFLHKVIKNLIHLRFLQFSDCLLDEMPSSIGMLPFLQIFICVTQQEVKIPNVFWKLKRLVRLVLIGGPFIIKRKLRLDSLSAIDTLVCSEFCSLGVKDLPKLTNLILFSLDVPDIETLSVIINCIEFNWCNIKVIGLRIQRNCDLISTADGSIMLYKLFICGALRKLEINVPIRGLPNHESGMLASSNLVSLRLNNCFVEEDPMVTLGKLPKLQDLCLGPDSFVGEEMTCTSSGFPKLTKLILDGLPNLKKWRIDEGAMPNLSSVSISKCTKLEMIPDGMKYLKELRNLDTFDMPKEFNDGIRVVDDREGADFHKVCHVPLISIEAEVQE